MYMISDVMTEQERLFPAFVPVSTQVPFLRGVFMKTSIVAFALFAALGGVAVAAAAPTAFVSDKSKDYFGYFLPAPEFKLGKWQLKDFFVGDKASFKTFEAGTADKAFGAVMIEFSDVTSPKKTSEDGQEYFSREIRILPLAYHV